MLQAERACATAGRPYSKAAIDVPAVTYPFNPHSAGGCIDAIHDAVVSQAQTKTVGGALQLFAGGMPLRVLFEEVDLLANSLPKRRRERKQVSLFPWGNLNGP